jgi:hypothetical protein
MFDEESIWSTSDEEAMPLPKRKKLAFNILEVTTTDSEVEGADEEEVEALAEVVVEEVPVQEVAAEEVVAAEELFKVASCMCKATGKCTTCGCTRGQLECHADCGCSGRCPNGPVQQKTAIRRSDIPGAGEGCFATVAIPKGQLVAEYRGRVVLGRMADSRRRPSRYLMDLDSPGQWVVDGEESREPVTRANRGLIPTIKPMNTIMSAKTTIFMLFS